MSIDEESPSESGAAAGSRERQLDFHPDMAMRWEITRTTADTGGELFEATNWVDSGLAGPPVHLHPTADESDEVTEGHWTSSSTASGGRCEPGKQRRCRPASPTRFETPVRTRSA